MLWSISLNNMPPRVNHSAVVIDHKIYSFGGYTFQQKIPDHIDVYVFNTVTYTGKVVHYRNKYSAPMGLYGHSTVAHRRKVYLWGGQTGEFVTDTVYCFDVDSLEWSIPETTGIKPNPADGHSACVIGDYMYIFGGYEQDFERFSSDVYRFHLLTHHWERVQTDGPTPESRDFHTASVIGDRMYIFGGRSCSDGLNLDEEFYSNKIMYLDTKTFTWVEPTCNGTPPCGRRSHSACVYRNEIYIIGGYEGLEEIHLNDVHKFDPETNSWILCKIKGSPPSPRRRHCACVIDDSLYLFGGSSPGPFPQQKPECVFKFFSMEQKLIEQSDMHILDFTVSLKRLAQMAIIQNILFFDLSILPRNLNEELKEILKNHKCHCIQSSS